MRMSLCVRAAVTAGLALGGYMASSTISFGIVGVSSAEAAQFYTRKRVNGVWITGRFPKAGSSARTTRGRRVAEPVRSVPTISRPTQSAALPAPAPPELRREPGGPDTTGSTTPISPAVRAPALPDIEAALVTAAVGPVAPVDGTALRAEERGLELRRALQLRADELAAKSANAGPWDGLAAMQTRPGLGDDAPSGAPSAQAGAAGPAEQAAAAQPREAGGLLPRSVSYDFERGIKTTVFENSVVREPFDVQALRGLTATSLTAR